MQQKDLNDDDMNTLHLGACAFVGTTDLAGRPLVIGCRSLILRFHPKCLQCMTFCMIQTFVKGNDMAQTKGIAFLVYNMSAAVGATTPNSSGPVPQTMGGGRQPQTPSTMGRPTLPLIRMLVNTLPFQFAALHNCYDSIKENFFVNLILVVLPKRCRARFLTHHQKTHEELCMVGLVPHGI